MKAPSVIIGVGGIGSQICAKIEQELNRVKGQKSGELENTRFVAIDTVSIHCESCTAEAFEAGVFC